MACSKPRARRVLLGSIVVVMGWTFASCGGSSKPQCTPVSGTPTGSGAITVTVSSGSLQHAITLNLNVTP